MHQLLYHPEAVKKLRRLHSTDRKRIIEKLSALSKNPNNPGLDIRKLANTRNSFRIRTGDLRVIFEIEEKEKTIYIWDIDYRGSIY